MAYTIEIVSTGNLLKLAQTDMLANFVKEKMLPEIGRIVKKHIQKKVTESFKRSSGKIHLAVTDEVHPESWEVWVYNDPRIAPYAKYQEYGVKKHSMNYLIGKTIPYKINGGRFMYAGPRAGGGGTGKTRFAKITAESIGKISKTTGKPMWIHPGYPGKYFYRNGIVSALDEIKQHSKNLVFRVASENGMVQ